MKRKGLHVQVEVNSPEDLIKLAEAAFEKGVKEVHLGWEHCAFCGKDIDPEEVQDMRIQPRKPGETLVLHLCDDCWPKFEKLGKKIGKG